MSTVETVRAVIGEQLDAARAALDSLATDGPATVLRVVDAALEPRGIAPEVRAETAGRIADILVRTVEHGRKTLDFERRLASAMGDPATLRARAATMETAVTRAAAKLAPDYAVSSLDAVKPENWSGATADRYRATMRGRQDAVAAVSPVSGLLGASLLTMADGIDQFYAALLAQVSSTTVTLLSAAVSISSWETASTGVLNVAATLSRIEGELATALTATLATNRAVEAQLAAALHRPLQWPDAGSAPSAS